MVAGKKIYLPFKQAEGEAMELLFISAHTIGNFFVVTFADNSGTIQHFFSLDAIKKKGYFSEITINKETGEEMLSESPKRKRRAR